MLLWPKELSLDDPEWVQACALMRCLPLDTRVQVNGAPVSGRGCMESAEEFLYTASNPAGEPLGFFNFRVHFMVGGGVYGSIAKDDRRSQEVFVEHVSEALQTRETRAIRDRWALVERWKVLKALKDPAVEQVKVRADGLLKIGMARYEEALEAVRGAGISSSAVSRGLLHAKAIDHLAQAFREVSSPQEYSRQRGDLSFG